VSILGWAERRRGRQARQSADSHPEKEIHPHGSSQGHSRRGHGQGRPALQKFYSDIFDWKLDTDLPDGYGMARDESGFTSGIGPTRDGSAGQVTFYVHSEDPARVLRRVEELGGRVLMPLTEVAKDTTIALFADPEGHVVGIM
jgi:hypothetical protein